MEKLQLKVKINSPNKIVWEGNADSVSSVNSQGPFDILPLHANFISIVENQIIKIYIDKKKTEYKFARAIIYANTNIVLIYTDI